MGRISRQLEDCQLFFMLLEELLHGFARMIASSILNKDGMIFDFVENGLKECGVAFRCESSFLTCIEEAPGEIVDQAQYLVTFSDAACFRGGLLPPFGPGPCARLA